MSYVASEFYFKTNSEQPYDSIRATITKNEAQSTIQNITSVYDRLAFEIQNLKQKRKFIDRNDHINRLEFSNNL